MINQPKRSTNKKLELWRFAGSLMRDFLLNNYIHCLTIDMKGTRIWHVEILSINVSDKSISVEYSDSYRYDKSTRNTMTVYGIKSYTTTSDLSVHEGSLYAITSQSYSNVKLMRANDDIQAKEKFKTYLELNRERYSKEFGKDLLLEKLERKTIERA